MIRYCTFLLLLFSCGAVFSQSLSLGENYIYERRYLEPVSVESPSAKQIQSVHYFDGLGRAMQSINIKASPTGKDLITPIEYDALGRQPKEYLSLPQSGTQKGAYYPTIPKATAIALYGDTLLYSEKHFENSPLNRILEQGAPGEPWSLASGNTVKYAYGANTQSDEVKRFTTVTSWSEDVMHSVLKAVSLSSSQPSTFYGPSQLYKNKITDEDGNIHYEFNNAFDQTILVREINGSTHLDTYYVYNEYDLLAFVLPPLASEALKSLPAGGVAPEPTLDLLSYQYRYDGRKRLAEKKLPTKGWEYMAYDKADRLALYQDAKGRLLNQWQFTKYDRFSRVAYTGIIPGASRPVEQAHLDAESLSYETRTSTPFLHSGLEVYYTNATYPLLLSSSRLLSVKYYDTYPPESPSQPSYIVESSQPTLTEIPTSYTQNGYSSTRSTKSLATATYLNELQSSSPKWTKDYYYYDLLARLVATHRFTPEGGYLKSEQLLNFSGLATYSYTRHKKVASDPEILLRERFLYDEGNRLTHHYNKVNEESEELLAHYAYDEVGRLSSKKVGGSLQAPLQDLTYSYNIRGWLTQLNNPSLLAGDLFGFTLRYQNPLPALGSKAKYNGSISQVDWNTLASPSALRRYTYSYDNLDRLLGAYYSKPGSTNLATQAYDELLSYDLNGNIKTLTRYGALDSSPAEKIDQLTYTYVGNALTKVVDTSGNPKGYPLGGSMITYDENGNMKSHLDKGISLIEYNALNLPSKIIRSAVTTSYSYLSEGTKLKKTDNQKTTEYYGVFQYEGPEGASLLQFAKTSEGYYDFVKNSYIYNYLDHLGNIRISYRKNSAGVLEILEENNYYPFGLKHEGYHGGSTATESYKFKFGGKELQENGMYDFGARIYMPDIGRWGAVDPLAEKYPSLSPYVYVANNPINAIDPDGRDIIYIVRDSKGNATEQWKYSNGSFRRWENGKLGAKYDGRTHTGSPELFRLAVQYRKIEHSKDEVLKGMLHTLEKSERTHWAEATDSEGSGVYPNGNGSGAGIKIGTQMVLNFSQEEKDRFTEMEGVPSTDFSMVTHEMRHQFDYDQGNMVDSKNLSGASSPTEQRAVKDENRARGIEKTKKRTTYGGERVNPNPKNYILPNKNQKEK